MVLSHRSLCSSTRVVLPGVKTGSDTELTLESSRYFDILTFLMVASN